MKNIDGGMGRSTKCSKSNKYYFKIIHFMKEM